MASKLPKSVQRNSSLELLRIIAMIFIIFHHFAVHGGFSFAADEVTIPHFWYNLIAMGGKIGVNVFVLISGYFLIDNTKVSINFRKLLKLWGELFFYSLIIALAFKAAGIGAVATKSMFRIIIRSLFPVTLTSWWFASTYFVLFLVHPFLNKLLHALEKKAYQKMLIVMLICWSLIPTLTMQAFQGSNLLWFITLYCVSAYVKLYGLNPKLKCRHFALLWLGCSALTYLSSVILIIAGARWPVFADYATYFFEQEKIPLFLSSLFLFMIFATMKMNYHKWINVIASATFGVYLIHDSDIVRPFLWESVFGNSAYQHSVLLIPYSIAVVAVVFVICTAIDLGRKKTIERLYMHIVNRYFIPVIKRSAKTINDLAGCIFSE